LTLPFLAQIADCLAAGPFTAARWRRGHETRTIRWYWQGIAVPAKLVASRDDLTAEHARIDNQELHRIALERLG